MGMSRKYLRMGLSITLGLCFGAAWGTALHNVGLEIEAAHIRGFVSGKTLNHTDPS